MSAVDPDVLQAQYFIVELERIAGTLVDDIDRLDALMGGQLEARRCRREFHQVRIRIDAIRRRFADQI